jgi:hypothetical protein
VSKRVANMLFELRAFNGDGDFIFSTTAGAKRIHSSGLSRILSEIAKRVPMKKR